MDIPNDLIYKDVELVHEFHKKTYLRANQEVIRFSFVFNLSHSVPEKMYGWDENKYELRTVSGVHVYCEGFLARHAEVTVKLNYDINCSKESKKVYVGTLNEAFNGQIPKRVCIITNLNQEPVAMGNFETNQFMYIEGQPRLVSKEYVIKNILSYIRVE